MSIHEWQAADTLADALDLDTERPACSLSSTARYTRDGYAVPHRIQRDGDRYRVDPVEPRWGAREIRRLRKRMAPSQTKFARTLGLGQGMISSLERDERVPTRRMDRILDRVDRGDLRPVEVVEGEGADETRFYACDDMRKVRGGGIIPTDACDTLDEAREAQCEPYCRRCVLRAADEVKLHERITERELSDDDGLEVI